MKFHLLILLPGIVLVSPVHGQSVAVVNQPVRSCSVADSMLGPEFIRNAGSVMTSPAVGGSQAFGTIPTRIIPAGAAGVVDFNASFFFPDTAVREMPPVQFNLKTVSTARLTIEQRQLMLTVDDSLVMDLGSMTAYEQHYPGSRDVHENLSIMAPTHRLTQVSRASRVTGRIGNIEFTVSEAALKNLKALLIAGLCYSSRAE